MDNFYAEKRTHKRLEFANSLQYIKLDANTRERVEAMIKDISREGISFFTNEFISLATRLVLTIRLPRYPRPIKVISKVIWIRKDSKTDRFELGNQFVEMIKEDQKLFEQYLGEAV
ncbi:MAG: PilZ domain-containing protein [Candidatus Omnitrophica bacterium]|nr:PilZ domain-containing protein [Candidatus Omnitrophota bacterium]